MSDEENTQPAPQPSQDATASNTEPTTTEAPVPFNEAQDKQQTNSVPVDVPLEATEAPASSEDPSTVKDVNPANEPLEQPAQPSPEAPANETEPEKTAQNNEQIPETPISQANSSSVQDSGGTKPDITIEKHGTDTTITEVMQPPASTATEPPTAQMAGNEPFDSAQDKPINNTDNEQARRKENLNKANLTRQSKKRKRIDNILNLFAQGKNGSTSSPQVTNDEVEKLLHVSDATATRYLETLEKEGKIKQVGKTGKYTHYEKI